MGNTQLEQQMEANQMPAQAGTEPQATETPGSAGGSTVGNCAGGSTTDGAPIPIRPLPEELGSLIRWLHNAISSVTHGVKGVRAGTISEAFVPIHDRLVLLLLDAKEKAETKADPPPCPITFTPEDVHAIQDLALPDRLHWFANALPVGGDWNQFSLNLRIIADKVDKQIKSSAERAEWSARYEDEQLQAIERVIKNHHDRIRVMHCGDISSQIASLLEHYHSKAVNSMSHTELFQQELLVNLRALALVANSVADGQTHTEKNARIRGLVGMLEGAYHKISKWRIDVQSSLPYWSYESVFQADYPVRHYLHRISDLEAALAKATNEPVQHAVARHDFEVDPFSDR